MYPESVITVRRRTPHGVRGLKSGEDGAVIIGEGVAPLTGCVD